MLNLAFFGIDRIKPECRVDIVYPAVSGFVTSQILVLWLFSGLSSFREMDHLALPNCWRKRVCITLSLLFGYCEIVFNIALQWSVASEFLRSHDVSRIINGIIVVSTLQIGLALLNLIPAIITVATASKLHESGIKERVHFMQSFPVHILDLVELSLLISFWASHDLMTFRQVTGTNPSVVLMTVVDSCQLLVAISGVSLELPMTLLGLDSK